MRTNGRSIKARIASAESELEFQVEKEIVTHDMKVAYKAWCNLVDWGHAVYEAGGYESAVAIKIAASAENQVDHPFIKMMPDWDISVLIYQVYGQGGGGDSLLYPLCSIFGELFDQGVLKEELKARDVMMAFCEIIKKARDELRVETAKKNDNNLG